MLLDPGCDAALNARRTYLIRGCEHFRMGVGDGNADACPCQRVGIGDIITKGDDLVDGNVFALAPCADCACFVEPGCGAKYAMAAVY